MSTGPSARGSFPVFSRFPTHFSFCNCILICWGIALIFFCLLILLRFQCETCTTGSRFWTLGPQLGMLSQKAPFRGGASLEVVGHWEWASGFFFSWALPSFCSLPSAWKGNELGHLLLLQCLIHHEELLSNDKPEWTLAPWSCFVS